MSLDPNKTYLVWNGTAFPNSTSAQFKAPAGSTIDWGDGTVETFDTASTTVNTHTYTDGKTEHTIAISGLTSISDSAFRGCSSLTSVTISNSVMSINYAAFNNCSSLTSVTIGNGVSEIGSAAFSWCSRLTSVTIPNSVTSISWDAFNNCSSLTSVTIPNSVTRIDSAAFNNCSKLTQLILFPSTPPTLGSRVIPTTIQSIYVQQSSKAAYQAATNWTTFASKIVSDNMYLSFVRFNQKNKEYISEKVGNKLAAPTTPTADSVVTMLANGTTGTKLLSEIGGGGGGGKLYRHLLNTNYSGSPNLSNIVIINNSSTEITELTEDVMRNIISISGNYSSKAITGYSLTEKYIFSQSASGSLFYNPFTDFTSLIDTVTEL